MTSHLKQARPARPAFDTAGGRSNLRANAEPAPERRPARRLLLLFLANLVVYGVVAFLVLSPGESDAELGSTLAGSQPLANAFSIPTPVVETIPIFTGFPTPTPAPPTGPGSTSVVTPTAAVPSFRPEDTRALNLPDTLNIVVMGVDRRPGWKTWRTDSLLLVSVHQRSQSVSVISIPRDLWVRIPNYGSERINTADFLGESYHYPGGGPALLKQTIQENLGVRVHYYVRLDFGSFIQGVDTLGGIDVDVDCRIDLFDVRGGLVLNPGLTHMDGETSLYYSRSRLTTNDIDRSRRQRKVLLAMFEKARSLNYATRWPELWAQFHEGVQTDLGLREMGALAYFASQLPSERIKMSALDFRVVHSMVTAAGEDVLVPDSAGVNSVLNSTFAPPDAKTDARAKEQAALQVTGTDGNQQTADLVATTLRREGYNIVGAGVRAEASATTRLVILRPRPNTVQQLAERFHIAPADIVNAGPQPGGPDLELILAKDYKSCAN